MSMSKNSSYGQILKSTAIIGSTQIINILIGIVRVKALALFLGPAGIGLAGMYQAATGMIGTLAGLGLGSAGVRQIAEAAGSSDEHRMARTVAVLRRASWVSGLLGMGLVLIFSKPLARATFGNDSYAGGVALVSLTLLFGSISAGQTALLQGLRRLKDLGVGLTIDNWANGAWLAEEIASYPVDAVKLARRLTERLLVDADERDCMQTELCHVHRCGLRAMISGIESVAAEAMAKECGFDLAQGFLWAGPLEAETLAAGLHGAP